MGGEKERERYIGSTLLAVWHDDDATCTVGEASRIRIFTTIVFIILNISNVDSNSSSGSNGNGDKNNKKNFLFWLIDM